jgi:cytochrome c
MACNRVGPMLGGILGRKAAVVADYPYYSDALKKSEIVWSEDVLDKMMTAPDKFLPGWGMQGAYLGKIDTGAQREDIIAFLKSGDTSLDLCPR